MNIGKLTNEQLQQSVLSILKPMRSEVFLRAGIGEDCAALSFGDNLCVVSTDPVTAAQKDLGRLAVHISCNDAASSGAEPIAMLLVLMAPPKCLLSDIESIMRAAFETAHELNVEIIGGHTEITDAVTRPILCGTVLAKCPSNELIRTAGGKIGDELILTKTAGIEGTFIIASDFPTRSMEILGGRDHAICLELNKQISVVPEGLLAARNGAHAMHDVTEGGVLGAAYELCEASGCGLLLEENDIKVLPQTKKLCAALRLDPLRLISSGCMLIACPDGKGMQQVLSRHGIESSIIGLLTHRSEGLRIMCHDGQIRPMGEPRADEIYKLTHRDS